MYYMLQNGQTITTMDIMPNYSLAACDTAPATSIPKGWACKSKKDESPMNYASATCVSHADTTEANKISYLSSQLYDAYQSAKTALQRKFGLIDDEAPETPQELIDRITSGLFVLPEKHKDKRAYGTAMSYIRWRDPKAVEDKVGYDAAKETLKAAYNAADRTIRILTPTEGLKALQDFETAQTPKAKK